MQVGSEMTGNPRPAPWAARCPSAGLRSPLGERSALGEVCMALEIGTGLFPQGVNKAQKNDCWLLPPKPLGILCSWDLGPREQILQRVADKSQV